MPEVRGTPGNVGTGGRLQLPYAGPRLDERAYVSRGTRDVYLSFMCNKLSLENYTSRSGSSYPVVNNIINYLSDLTIRRICPPWPHRPINIWLADQDPARRQNDIVVVWGLFGVSNKVVLRQKRQKQDLLAAARTGFKSKPAFTLKIRHACSQPPCA